MGKALQFPPPTSKQYQYLLSTDLKKNVQRRGPVFLCSYAPVSELAKAIFIISSENISPIFCMKHT